MFFNKLIKTTICEVYNQTQIKDILLYLERNQYIDFNKISLFNYNRSNVLDVSHFNEYSKEVLLFVLENIPEAVYTAISYLQLFYSYNYSVIFEAHNELCLEKLQELKSTNMLFDFKDYSQKKLAYSTVNDAIPFMYEDESYHYFLFTIKQQGFLNLAKDHERNLLYSVLCCYSKIDKTVEIRYNSVAQFIKAGNNRYYKNLIDNTINRLNELFDLNLIALNISPIIKYISDEIDKKESPVVEIIGKTVNFRTGQQAKLASSANGEAVLPLLGNLKSVLKEYHEMLDSCENSRQIRSVLQRIIQEAEVLANHPAVTLRWKVNNNTTFPVQSKTNITFNYYLSEYSVLKHLNNWTNMERMSYVTKYLYSKHIELELSTKGNANK